MNKTVIGDCTLYNCDFREILGEIKAATIVTDPPFNVGYHYDEHDDKMNVAEYWGMLSHFSNQPAVFIHYIEQLFEIAFVRRQLPDEVVAWVYNANTPKQWRSIGWFGVKPDFTKCGQPYKNPNDKRVKALIEQGKEARLYDWWNVQQVKNVSLEKTDHPCQMPLEIMDKIIKITPPVRGYM